MTTVKNKFQITSTVLSNKLITKDKHTQKISTHNLCDTSIFTLVVIYLQSSTHIFHINESQDHFATLTAAEALPEKQEGPLITSTNLSHTTQKVFPRGERRH